MCTIRDVIYGIIGISMCLVLIHAVQSNEPEQDFKVIELNDVIKNEHDLMVLNSLGLQNYVCVKEKDSDAILCARKGSSFIH